MLVLEGQLRLVDSDSISIDSGRTPRVLEMSQDQNQ